MFAQYQDKRKEKRREKKQNAKAQTKLAKKQGKMSEAEVAAMTADEKKQRAELDLLIDDGTETGERSGKRDVRFVREEDHDFAVDPTHKEYRKVTQGHNKIKSKRSKK